MGWTRAHSTVVEERLISWFLFKRTFPMTVEQLAELVRQTSGAAHIKNITEYYALRKTIQNLNKPPLTGVINAK